MRTVYFVCTGNTCRSPMAEGMFRKMLSDKEIKDVQVKSCGLYVSEGAFASRNAVLAAAEYGADISKHSAVQFSPEFVSESAVFVCMTESHLLRLLESVPRDQLFVLGDGIPDPYMGDLDTYRECAEAIHDALPELMAALGIEK